MKDKINEILVYYIINLMIIIAMKPRLNIKECLINYHAKYIKNIKKNIIWSLNNYSYQLIIIMLFLFYKVIILKFINICF